MDIGELINIKTLEDETNAFDKSEKHTRYTTEIKILILISLLKNLKISVHW